MFPDSLVDKFKICTDIALAIKRLGYPGDMTYNKFLYPAEDDLYKLVRFLVEKLPESSDGVKIPYVNGIKEMKIDDSSNSLEDYMEKADRKRLDINNHQQKLKELDLHDAESELCGSNAKDVPSTGTFSNEKSIEQGDDEHFQKVSSADNQTSKTRDEIEALQYQEKVLMKKVAQGLLKFRNLKRSSNCSRLLQKWHLMTNILLTLSSLANKWIPGSAILWSWNQNGMLLESLWRRKD